MWINRIQSFIFLFHPDIVAEYAERTLDGKYVCKVCLTHVTHKKYNMRTHLEGKHHMSYGYACDLCSDVVYKTKQEVNQHKRMCAQRLKHSLWIKIWYLFVFCQTWFGVTLPGQRMENWRAVFVPLSSLTRSTICERTWRVCTTSHLVTNVNCAMLLKRHNRPWTSTNFSVAPN